MNIIKPKAEELSVLVRGGRSTKLTDRRIKTNGIFFGTVEDVAKNLGITLSDTDRGLKASAPKTRLQIFVEKLHFAGVAYIEV